MSDEGATTSADEARSAGERAVREAALIEDDAALRGVIAELEGAEELGLDVEANGMFVYRARLCMMQLAYVTRGAPRVAIVDTLRVDPSPLAELLGPRGPRKILHDLAFDARLLAEYQLPLGRVSDTSVMARFVGLEATGLASVAATVLGLELSKGLQQHDWSERPLTSRQRDYLASDVAYLLPMFHALEDRARALDVLEEADEESAYRLRSALQPAPATRPSWSRLKGSAELGPVARAVLRRLHALREHLAAEVDRPSHRIMANERLLELARRRPTSPAELARIVGGGRPEPWLEAVRSGIADGDVPEEERAALEPRLLPPESVARRRRAEGLVTAWRAREAERRGVDPQAVLPGHCASALASLLHEPPPLELRRERVGAIDGIGARRIERYTEAWLGLFALLDAPPAPKSA